MDALVDGLLEELNCETVFTIPLFGGIPVYESVVVTWIIMAVVFLLCFLLGRNLSVENPGRRQVAVEAAELFAKPDIDGGLVGGASLKADFGKIVNYK